MAPWAAKDRPIWSLTLILGQSELCGRLSCHHRSPLAAYQAGWPRLCSHANSCHYAESESELTTRHGKFILLYENNFVRQLLDTFMLDQAWTLGISWQAENFLPAVA